MFCIKYIDGVGTGHIFLLVVTDNVMECLVTISLYRGTSHETEALVSYVFCKHVIPIYLIFDEVQAFLSSVM